MQKTKLASLILLFTLLLSSCASAQGDNSPLPIKPIPSSTSSTPEAEWGLWEGTTSAPAAHDCDLENYYTIDIVHEPEYEERIVVYDIQGREIYRDSYWKGFHVKYVDNCILSVTYYTGTMNKVVHYVDVHNGREAQYDNPVLAGNGVVAAGNPHTCCYPAANPTHANARSVDDEGILLSALWRIAVAGTAETCRGHT